MKDICNDDDNDDRRSWNNEIDEIKDMFER